MLGAAATASVAATIPRAGRAATSGGFAPNRESLLAQYKAPYWFRNAKFGIWAHWGVQCVPEFGDWYARRMYM